MSYLTPEGSVSPFTRDGGGLGRVSEVPPFSSLSGLQMQTLPPFQQTASRLLWCSTTGCLGSGLESTKCRRCLWIIRDYAKYKTITLPNGTQAHVANTRHDEDNEAFAQVNSMRAEELSGSSSGHDHPSHNDLDGNDTCAKTVHAHPEQQMMEQLQQQQAEEQHRRKIEVQRARHEQAFWYAEAQKVQALVEKEGWVDESEMWRTDGIEDGDESKRLSGSK